MFMLLWIPLDVIMLVSSTNYLGIITMPKLNTFDSEWRNREIGMESNGDSVCQYNKQK